MDSLENAYKSLKDILGEDIEPFESVRLIDMYRQYWKPEIVNVILLAESHVYTTLQDMDLSFDASLPGYPTTYAKFVYCLAYGEKALTSDRRHPPRDGTPQFWKIFYSCLNDVSGHDDFNPIKSVTPFDQRLANKISLLQELKRKGVWLIDTSIVALYHQGNKPDQDRLGQALKSSWQNQTFKVIKESNPKHVICIGKGVGNVVSNGLRRMLGDNVTVLPQPNARLSTEEHLDAFRTYFRICNEYCSS